MTKLAIDGGSPVRTAAWPAWPHFESDERDAVAEVLESGRVNYWSAKDHGKSWEAVYEREHPPGFRWPHETLGTNGRMTELQAAVGLCQLGKLDMWVARRRGHAVFLRRALSRHAAFDTPEPPPDVYGAYYRLYTRARPEALADGWDRDRLMVALEAEGLPCRVGSCTEILREKVFDALPRPELPVAAQLARVALSFTTHPTSHYPVGRVLAGAAGCCGGRTHAAGHSGAVSAA